MTASAIRLPTPRVVSSAIDEEHLSNLAELYAERWRLSPEAIACREFDARAQCWRDLTWDALAQRAGRFAAGLKAMGLRPGERVAIRLHNGSDWLAIDWANQSLGLVTVGLPADETPAASALLLADCGARVVFLGDDSAWSALKVHLDEGALRHAVLMHGGTHDHDRRPRSLAQWLPQEGALLEAAAPAGDFAALIYTSGSTGTSRGVMLSHANFLSNAFACQRAIELRGDDVLYTLLPLAQAFGRTACAYQAIVSGATLVFGRDASSFTEDLIEQKPTLLFGVPRLFERIYGALLAEVDEQPPTRRALFRLAVETGWAAKQADIGALKLRLLPTGLARKVGGELRARLGGRLRLIVSGGAGLSPEIARTFIALGIPLVQGYGLTEAGPVVSVDRPDDVDPASAGRVLEGVETRIAASGELLVRSPGVMLGYWNDEAATRAVLDDAGWLATGDKASRLDTERLYLTGRIKEVLVMATGEKIAPALIEQHLAAVPLIDQVMVIGEARPHLAALIVARPGLLALLRGHLGVNDGDDSLAARVRIEAHLLEQCREHLCDAPRHEAIGAVALVDQPWTVDNGLITATQKLRRCQILRRHAAEVTRLYAGHYSMTPTDCSNNAGLSLDTLNR